MVWYSMRDMVLLSFFYIQQFIFPTSICWRVCYSNVYFHTFVKKRTSECKILSLFWSPLFSSILCQCYAVITNSLIKIFPTLFILFRIQWEIWILWHPHINSVVVYHYCSGKCCYNFDVGFLSEYCEYDWLISNLLWAYFIAE